jgi:hypothetical protein
VVWIPLLALLNLLAFLAVRGRWGRIVVVLAVASVLGVALGDLAGDAVGLELLRIGDMHVLAASIGSQLLMLIVTLLAALGPVRVSD